MVNSISIDNYKAVRHLELPSLRKLTILTGQNGSGKTSVLECVSLLLRHKDGWIFSHFAECLGNRERYADTEKPVVIVADLDGITCDMTFSSSDSDEKLDIAYYDGDGREELCITEDDKELRNEFIPVPGTTILMPLPKCVYLDLACGYDRMHTAMRVSKVLREGNRQVLLDILMRMAPSVSDINVTEGDIFDEAFVRKDGVWMTPMALGRGLYSLLCIALEMICNPHSVILLDGIDTGFHQSSFRILWDSIVELSEKYDCQVIATAYSYECIRDAVYAVGDSGLFDSMCLIRLYLHDGKNCSAIYPGELVKEAIEGDMEVR